MWYFHIKNVKSFFISCAVLCWTLFFEQLLDNTRSWLTRELPLYWLFILTLNAIFSWFYCLKHWFVGLLLCSIKADFQNYKSVWDLQLSMDVNIWLVLGVQEFCCFIEDFKWFRFTQEFGGCLNLILYQSYFWKKTCVRHLLIFQPLLSNFLF